MMATLVQIGTIPPLTQSFFEMMACPESYVQQIIHGVQMPGSIPSERGQDIHRIMSEYIDHCVKKRTPGDWTAFDEISKAAGPDAGPIVDGMRETYVVEHNSVVATEWTIRLDENFKLIADDDHTTLVAYKGTLDVTMVLSLKRGKIDDFKSHPLPFDADTFQSMLYPFMLFIAVPTLQEITFELIFVRYKNARRSVTWTRDQMPEMMRQIERGRQRQLKLHADVASGRYRATAETVHPGNHCQYCPHLSLGTCPAKEMNPHTNTPITDRLSFLVWLEKERKLQIEVLKAHVDANGGTPVRILDNNGNAHEYGPQDTESGYYPLAQTFAMLADWHQSTGENPFEWKGLRVGSTQLKSKLKAKKRAALHQRMDDEVLVKETKVKVKLSRPNDGEEDEEEEEEEYSF